MNLHGRHTDPSCDTNLNTQYEINGHFHTQITITTNLHSVHIFRSSYELARLSSREKNQGESLPCNQAEVFMDL